MSDKKPANINIALIAIMQAINAIPKAQKNEAQGFRFRGIDDVLNHLHPIFAQHSVVCAPVAEAVNLREFTNAKGNKVFAACVTVNYRFMSADGSVFETKSIGEAYDSGDKAVPKAFSMAFKTMLTQMFLIPTADLADADGQTYSFDAAAESRKAPGDEYKGKTLEQLVALRDGIMASGDVPPKDLLGAIAELKAKQDDIDMTPAPKKEGKKPEPEKKAAPEKKAEKAPAKAAPEKPEKKEQAAPEEAPAAPEETPANDDVFSHQLTTVMHSAYKGKKLGDLTLEQLQAINKGWIQPNLDKFEPGTPKAADKDAILKAIALSTK